MGCNLRPRGRVCRGGADRIRATCCLISSLLISSCFLYIYTISSLMLWFTKIVCSVVCRELKGDSSDIFHRKSKYVRYRNL